MSAYVYDVPVCACVCVSVYACMRARISLSMSIVEPDLFPGFGPKNAVCAYCAAIRPAPCTASPLGIGSNHGRPPLELAGASSSIVIGSSFVSELPPPQSPCSGTFGTALSWSARSSATYCVVIGWPVLVISSIFVTSVR